MNQPCGCCEGLTQLTPLEIANRPGLDILSYRVGTHGTFLESMQARLSSLYLKLPSEEIKNWLLQSTDLFNPAQLLVKLRDGQAGFTKHLREQLSSEFQTLLAAYDVAQPPSVELQTALLKELNQLLPGSLYKAAEVAQLLLTPDIQFLLSRENLSDKEIIRLNRLLLEAAFPLEIKPRQHLYPLQALTTREVNDPSIALLDAWASVADVLTFYQERIANEGYLHTATERRSILELAYLVGYQPRPGLAASVYLAFTTEKDFNGIIPQKTRAQSIPGPGELPQSFETFEDLTARAEWNVMRPRLSLPQVMSDTTASVYLEGLQVNLKPNDPVLVMGFDSTGKLIPLFRRVHGLETEAVKSQTRVFLRGDLSLGALQALQTGAPTSVLPKLPTPQNLAPVNETKNVPLDVTLRWRGPNPNDAHSGITYEIAFGTEHPLPRVESPTFDFDGDYDFVTYTPLKLNPNTHYYWYVTTVAKADCRRTPGPEWSFTTVDSTDPSTPTRPGNPDPDDGYDYTVEKEAKAIKLSWAGDEPEKVDYSLAFDEAFQANQPFRLVIERTKTDNPFTLEPDGRVSVELPLKDISEKLSPLQPGKTYYWQVTAKQNNNQVTAKQNNNVSGPVWSFRIAPQPSPALSPEETQRRQEKQNAVQQASKNIINKINERLATLLSTNNLGNSGLSAAQIRNLVNIELATFDHPVAAFQAFNGLQDAGLDFCQLLEWVVGVDGLRTQLQNISTQADLRRGVTGTAGRLYPNNFIKPGGIHSIIQYLEDAANTPAGPFATDAALQTFAEDRIRQVKDDIENLLEMLRDGSVEEDEKIRAVKEQRNRLVLLWQIFSYYNLAELGRFQGIQTWISDSGLSQNGEVVVKNGWIALLDDVITGMQQVSTLPQLIPSLLKRPSTQPANRLRLERNMTAVFEDQADTALQLLTTLQGQLKGSLYQAWAGTEANPLSSLQGIEALRVKAAPYGAITFLKPQYDTAGHLIDYVEKDWSEIFGNSSKNILTLDAEYNQIMPGGWVVIEWSEDEKRPKLKDEQSKELNDANPNRLIRQAVEVYTISKPNFGKVTELKLNQPWREDNDTLSTLLRAVVYTQNESLTLAEEPQNDDIGLKGQEKEVELDGLYQGLQAGRWLIVAGERTDIPGTVGVKASELVMLAGIKHHQFIDRPGDTPHTTLTLANEGLAYTYKRNTITIYGNVVKATHGETRPETLGSGDARQSRQSFTLKQKPLTYLAAPTPAGAENTLEVRVNNVRWHEADNLVQLESGERGYITRTDNEGQTTITFGDGQHGARLPTGMENIKAVYRNGLGPGGNVAAGQISLLATRPLGVKEVVNPQAAAGGAGPERRDQARRNVPLALLALDRLISFQDYEDFARSYAGIDKASAVRLREGRRELIHLTIAGVDDAPITENSDLYRGLRQALHRFGYLSLPVQLAPRELMLLIVIANVRLHPDYLWEAVEPQIRAALQASFSFERRELGQAAHLSEVMSVIQGIPGVVYVDVDKFDNVSEGTPHEELKKLAAGLRRQERIGVNLAGILTEHKLERPSETLSSIAERYNLSEVDLWQVNPEITDPNNLTGKDTIRLPHPIIRPAQLAYLSPEVPDTLILKEISR